VRAFYSDGSPGDLSKGRNPRRVRRKWTLIAALVLSLGIGAKIYPIVLAPILFLPAWRRLGPKIALLSGIIALTVATMMLSPMLLRASGNSAASHEEIDEASSQEGLAVEPRLPESGSSTSGFSSPQRPRLNVEENSTGIAAFASRWQMNDFLFLLVFENLKPIPSHQASGEEDLQRRSGYSDPWFVVTSREWRRRYVDAVAVMTSLNPQQIPFLTARLITGVAFILLAVYFAVRGMQSEAPTDWLRQVFLTIAWFWLLLPTQNPWYWIWALPFLPFARSRAWLVLSGLTLMYYSRFWFSFHMADTLVCGTPYAGVHFYDLVVVFIEFGPWFVWLASSSSSATRISRSSKGSYNPP